MDSDNPAQADKQNRNAEIEKFKVFLGPISTRYTDAQLIQLHSDMQAAARLLLDLYLLKKEGGRKDQTSFDNPQART